SHKINWALDRTEADLIVYLDNGSLPAPGKFAAMVPVAESSGAAYCRQLRTGHTPGEYPTVKGAIDDAYCVLNYTQVMHRRTDDRWSLDMRNATPIDIADALFWRELHKSIGPF